MHMKKFFDIPTIIVSAVFVIGLISTAIAANWTAFIWAFIGLLWMLFSRCMAVRSEAEITKVREESAVELAEARKERKYYADKYDAKLQENQMLSEKLALLQDEYTKVLDASDKQLGSPVDSEPKVHGNIKVKRKKKTVAEIKADIKGKTE